MTYGSVDGTADGFAFAPLVLRDLRGGRDYWLNSRQRLTGRPWDPANRQTIVDNDDSDLTTKAVDVLSQFGEVARTKTGRRAADRKIQQTVQHIAYAAGYSQNWETTIVKTLTAYAEDFRGIYKALISRTARTTEALTTVLAGCG